MSIVRTDLIAFASIAVPKVYRSGVGRGCGVGRGLGVTLGVAVGGGVVVGVGVTDGVTVGVAVGVGDGGHHLELYRNHRDQ